MITVQLERGREEVFGTLSMLVLQGIVLVSYILLLYIPAQCFFQTWTKQLAHKFIFLVTCEANKSQNFRSRILTDQFHDFNLQLLSLMPATSRVYGVYIQDIETVVCILPCGQVWQSRAIHFFRYNTYKRYCYAFFQALSRSCEPLSSAFK